MEGPLEAQVAQRPNVVVSTQIGSLSPRRVTTVAVVNKLTTRTNTIAVTTLSLPPSASATKFRHLVISILLLLY